MYLLLLPHRPCKKNTPRKTHTKVRDESNLMEQQEKWWQSTTQLHIQDLNHMKIPVE